MLLWKVKRKTHISNRNQLLYIPRPVLISWRGNQSLQRFLQGNYCLFFNDTTVFLFFLHISPLQLPPHRKQISSSLKKKKTGRKLLVFCIMWPFRLLNCISFCDPRLQYFMVHAVYTHHNWFSVINVVMALRGGTAA